jgi:hypothetical protein
MPPNALGIAGYTNQCNLVSLCLLLLPLLQAKVEEPRAADTEGPDMNPQDATDATRAVGSRAKRWQWFVWLADCSDFFVSSPLSHGWSFCNLLHIAFSTQSTVLDSYHHTHEMDLDATGRNWGTQSWSCAGGESKGQRCWMVPTVQ